MTSFYIYIHRKATDNSVFYVGRGNRKRLLRTDGRNQHWHNIVKKHGFVAEIIEQDLSSEKANEREKFWIAQFRDDGCILANVTDGGGGTCGWRRSEEQRQKLSESLTGVKWDEARKKRWKGNTNGVGYVHSDEAKQAISETHKGKPKSESHRHKLSAALKGRKLNLTPEQKAKRSEASKRYWAMRRITQTQGI